MSVVRPPKPTHPLNRLDFLSTAFRPLPEDRASTDLPIGPSLKDMPRSGPAYTSIAPHPAAPDRCFTATDAANGDAVFIKVCEAASKFYAEVAAMQRLADAPYVCRLRHHAFYDEGPLCGKSTTDGHRRVGVIVQDLAVGYITLLELFERETGCRTDEPYAATVCAIYAQLLDVLRDLARRNLVHADIKPENILYHPGTGSVRLIDFEFAIANGAAQSICGSFPYIDYALLTLTMPRGAFHCTNDLWALAITMYRMLLAGVPCDPSYDDTHRAFHSFRHSLRNWPRCGATAELFVFPPHSVTWSASAARCIAAAERCLTPTYRTRPTIDEVLALLHAPSPPTSSFGSEDDDIDVAAEFYET